MSTSEHPDIGIASGPRHRTAPADAPASNGTPAPPANEAPSPDDMTIERLLEITPPDSRELVRKAYDFAAEHHEGQRRLSGEAYIHHPVAVAGYLAELHLDGPTIAAGLLHDVLEDTKITRDQLSETFPSPVPEIVQGVTKIGKMNFSTNREAQVENLRLMILAMAKDIRVVIVKLCDRLHNMKTLKHLPPEKRVLISQETMDIYAPLANRLGIAKIKSEMEDLAMRWLYPEAYQKLTKHIAQKKRERERLVEESIQFLRDYLGKSYSSLAINGRPKHFYSIHKKMKEQNLSFDQIYDLNAMRVVCEEKSQCYEILGLIHEIWPPLPGRFKDYVATPKKNQYQSLHTTVMGYRGAITEIQIRTREMHTIAEFGIAAHWNYKEKGVRTQDDERLAWLRQLSEWVTDVNEPDGLLDALKKDVFADSVLCFTPKGDVIELPANATPIDFAYSIHTKVGEQCVGAKVNNVMVNLRTKLHNGDVVEVVTSPTGHPSRDWLDYTVTGRAKQKIKHWLKSKNIDEWIDNGRRAVERIIDERQLHISKEELDQALDSLVPAYKLQNREDLLVEIGFGSISPQAAIARMNPDWATKAKAPSKKFVAGKRRGTGPIIIEGLEGIPTRISSCCSPLPGDPIIGFVTRGRGVTIHHEDCKNVLKARQDRDEGLRILPAMWNMQGTASHTRLDRRRRRRPHRPPQRPHRHHQQAQPLHQRLPHQVGHQEAHRHALLRGQRAGGGPARAGAAVHPPREGRHQRGPPQAPRLDR
jgi:guanosine-3',5'-bis(diphosphate) 3'-pyrophosphohydrolase